MGKDNIPFHTISFPVTLLAVNDWCEKQNLPERWKTVDYIKGMHWMNYYEGKFSTTMKRGVFMDDALALLPADFWRWYLITNAPENNDSNFTWELLQAVANKDLANILGNLVNRVTKFSLRYFGSIVPQGEYGAKEQKLIAEAQTQMDQLRLYMERIALRKSAAQLRAIWSLGNEYLQEAAPWKIVDEMGKGEEAQLRIGAILRFALNYIGLCADLSYPFIPFTAEKLRKDLGLCGKVIWPESAKSSLQRIEAGADFTAPELLFPKIETDQIVKWRKIYGGDEG